MVKWGKEGKCLIICTERLIHHNTASGISLFQKALAIIRCAYCHKYSPHIDNNCNKKIKVQNTMETKEKRERKGRKKTTTKEQVPQEYAKYYN